MSTSRKKIDYWDVSKTREKRSTIDWLTDSKSKKIDNWLSVEDSSKKIDTIDLLIEFSFFITMNWLTFRTRRSTIDCHYRWLTIILADSRCVKWKWDSIIALKERTSSLTQIHDHSRWFTMRIVKVRCIHRLQRQNFTLWRFYFDSRISTNDLTIFFNYSRISTSISDDFILLTRVFRWAICFKAEDLIECQLVSQNSEREICCVEDVKMISSSSLLIERFRAEDEIVTNWQRSCFFLLADFASVKFTSLVTMKIKYNVRRMSRKQIT